MPIPGVTTSPLRDTYDVVIIGAGIQGLALAYELTKLDFGRIAVLEAGYPGSGASGRNGEMIRSAFSSREWIELFDTSLRRWQTLSAELDFNVLFSRAGYLVLGSTEEQTARLAHDHQRQREFGLNTQLLDRDQALAAIPEAAPDLVQGGLLQLDGGYAHHDATIWGYARSASRGGAEIHARTRVSSVEVDRGRVVGVTTQRGSVSTPIVVNAAGGFANELAQMAGIALPSARYRLEMIVTESLAPFLDPAVAVLELLGYCHQTTRGEFVGGTEYKSENPADDVNVTLEGLRDMARKFVGLFPRLAGARLIRHWAGLVDQAADHSPVLGPVPELEGFYLDCGWTYGFMGAPGAAELLAATIAHGALHPIIKPFGIERLRTGELIHEGTLVMPDRRPEETV